MESGWIFQQNKVTIILRSGICKIVKMKHVFPHSFINVLSKQGLICLYPFCGSFQRLLVFACVKPPPPPTAKSPTTTTTTPRVSTYYHGWCPSDQSHSTYCLLLMGFYSHCTFRSGRKDWKNNERKIWEIKNEKSIEKNASFKPLARSVLFTGQPFVQSYWLDKIDP